MTTYGFSQTTYPKRILYNGDTLLAITYEQTVKINRSLNKLLSLEEVFPELKKEISVLEGIQEISAQQIETQRQIISKKDLQLQQYDEYMEKSKQYTESLQATLKKDRARTIKTAIGVGVGGTLIGILFGAFFIH